LTIDTQFSVNCQGLTPAMRVSEVSSVTPNDIIVYYIGFGCGSMVKYIWGGKYVNAKTTGRLSCRVA